jgi:uroporphyrinogen-III decarboxylase
LTRFFQAAGSKEFKVAVHQCGNTVAVLKDMAGSGADFLELDAVTDMKQAKEATRGKTAVLGMVDPANVMHLGSRELVREKTRLAIQIMGPGGGFIVGPGCAIAPETPAENVAAMVDCALAHGHYRSDGSVGL